MATKLTTRLSRAATPAGRAPTRSRRRQRIVIAGGGFAALESLLALRELLGSAPEITVVATSDRFAYRPAATAEAFGSEPPRGYHLPAIAAELGAAFRRDRLAAVAAEHRRARLASFATLRYDALVLAVGARARSSIPGALTFHDQRDVPQMRRLLSDVRAGLARRIVFAVPPGCAWPLPLYELAMLTAQQASEHRVGVEITLVSPASEPLDVFGPDCSRLVADMLAARGVRFLGDTTPAYVDHGGSLALHPGGHLPADRVVAAPQLRGPRISGVPSGRFGFVPVDAGGRVQGLRDVYAAGDMTSFPVKQGGLAAQQADVIAHTIASVSGASLAAPPAPPSPSHLLQARLLGGPQPVTLQTLLDASGRPAAPQAIEWESEVSPADSEKVDGRYLGAFLAGREPLTV